MGKIQEEIKELSIKHAKLQTLMHYVNEENLKQVHEKQDKKKAVGIDGVTKEQYSEQLEDNIKILLEKMKKFGYKPKPTRRVMIPKSDGKMRSLGILSYEDKLVQTIMAEILNGVYEPRFLDISYGFRPNRNCHQAIKMINNTIMHKNVNYILDCDIKGFFDNVDQGWLMKFLEHDIQDKNFLRYIVRFLKAGIWEDMKYVESDKGTIQGGNISPVLANVYLHYVLDIWFEKSVKPKLHGEAYLVRYADDFAIQFQAESEAEKVYKMLIERLKTFGLEVAIEKTRIIPFGKHRGTKENFDFLGFTFVNGKTKNGKYRVHINTSKKKLKVKRQNAKSWLKEVMHKPIDTIMKSLKRKLVGHYNYYGISGNIKGIKKFHGYVKYQCYKRLNRRHQKKSMSYDIFEKIWEAYIPSPKICVNIW
ncbi:group II intron reverse transcriptase/maturase [Sedimentibacter sp. zth1]|uniref:group II intron reverse transcriptase/maturase n=2 Tax=Sedimentibacter sp. zth1 TaxID=2816908 RepID=UPI001A90DD5C|nr:group II intron reverse transcriptase/maturase [Sedimentibacter sp. zth1]QSX04644.1 group II intron reverse transcriptase/maturase [Sedimentibacter sp. zth1]QSX06649.1 group II intron reverse transcriptase/maturase [Sedimentibacter sp. zth1]QSX06677.1 group II intron reverse transcriptase/maturase [Sedimentibacter sp. zth1]